MTDTNEPSGGAVQAAEARVEPKRRFSIIWIIPITAAVIGAWLVYKAHEEKGPTVTITFSAAQGVEAGKTKIKFKDVIVGQVEKVELSDDFKKVTITADLDKTFEGRLSENSRFWIVAPRLAGGNVSGLGTLLSGVYIGMDPGAKGKAKRHFEGLSIPPLVSAGTPGRHFWLTSPSLGSLDLGSPVYFRQLKAGEVESYQLDEDGKSVRLRVFVHSPYDKFVDSNTRFWNASGISASMTAAGIKVSTESLVALLVGGIAFDSLDNAAGAEAVDENHMFNLHGSKEEANARVFEEKFFLQMYFSGSIRGLSIGAPLEIRGIKLGEVTSVEFHADVKDYTFRIPVVASYEPGRIKVLHSGPAPTTMEGRRRILQNFVDHGLRAQLKTGSLLTGQLFVELDFHPDAPPAQVTIDNGRFVFPTIPGDLEELRTSLTDLMNRLRKFPIEKIGDDLKDTMHGASELVNSEELRQSLKHLDETLADSQQFAAQLNEQTAPALNKTLNEAIATLTVLQQSYLQEDSDLYFELNRTLTELSNAARSVGELADYLERHPNALLTGK